MFSLLLGFSRLGWCVVKSVRRNYLSHIRPGINIDFVLGQEASSMKRTV
jgi:hypothetical protein